MRPKLRRAIVAGLLACGPASAHAIQVGDAAPDFTLLDGSGRPTRSAPCAATSVLLAFVGYD